MLPGTILNGGSISLQASAIREIRDFIGIVSKEIVCVTVNCIKNQNFRRPSLNIEFEQSKV